MQNSQKKFDLSLYLVTARSLAHGRDLECIVREAVMGGVTMVQLREKNISKDEFIDAAISMKKVLMPFNIPLIINDNIEVALSSGADGIHIGQSDMPCTEARNILGEKKIIGLSVENMSQIIEANELDVDYIGLSPAFSTQTKKDTSKPFGLDGIKDAMKVTGHPAVAIGGINRDNAADVIAAGVDGIAVVSAICGSHDPGSAARELRKIINISFAEYKRP